MEQRRHEFEVPDGINKMTRSDAELLFPSDPGAVIYSGLQKVFIESSGGRERPAQKRPPRIPQPRKP